jgi:7-cyano-7-deazaguanine synthase
MPSAIVLLSSGLDSTVNLCCAMKEYKIPLALTFDYGQRAAAREISQSQKICASFGIEHQVIALPWLKDITHTSLVNREQSVPQGAAVEIDSLERSEETAKAVWVPNRNGVFLNIAASFAESYEADFVIPGFNAEEAVTFADNSTAFLQALDHSFSYSTRSKVQTKCFTQNLDKTQIVTLGKSVGAPFDLMWPCYFSGETLCGECESCQRFSRALAAQNEVRSHASAIH